jgi:hypothetical protein
VEELRLSAKAVQKIIKRSDLPDMAIYPAHYEWDQTIDTDFDIGRGGWNKNKDQLQKLGHINIDVVLRGSNGNGSNKLIDAWYDVAKNIREDVNDALSKTKIGRSNFNGIKNNSVGRVSYQLDLAGHQKHSSKQTKDLSLLPRLRRPSYVFVY